MNQSGEHPMYASHMSYDEQLNKGLRISGSDKQYFAAARVKLLAELWQSPAPPGRILDFGAGDGSTLAILRGSFPAGDIVAAEPSHTARQAAAEEAAATNAEVVDPSDLDDADRFDLIYMNGVVHHVSAHERDALISWLVSLCAPDGQIVIFENNPWNLGARYVMRRIPFDADVVMVWPSRLREAFMKAGVDSFNCGSLFFFPRSATATPQVERALRKTMLGAQYFCSARRTVAPGSLSRPLT